MRTFATEGWPGECPSALKAGAWEEFGALPARLVSARLLVLLARRRVPCASAAGERGLEEEEMVTTMGASVGKSHCWCLSKREGGVRARGVRKEG